MDTQSVESLLLLAVPEAQVLLPDHGGASPAVFPAHITVGYPFKPVGLLDARDLAKLRSLCVSTRPFDIALGHVGSFGDEVLFVAPADPAPVVALIRKMEAAFPDYPIYGGAFAELHPHLTLATRRDGCDFATVKAEAERLLPLTHRARSLQLWAGPALASNQPGWGLVDSFPLG